MRSRVFCLLLLNSTFTLVTFAETTSLNSAQKILRELKINSNVKLDRNFNFYKNQDGLKICAQDELIVGQIENTLISKLKSEFQSINLENHKDAKIIWLNSLNQLSKFNEIEKSEWRMSNKLTDISSIEKYLKLFKKIDYADIAITDYVINVSERSSQDFTPSKIALNLTIEINGVLNNNLRRSDKVKAVAIVENVNSVWRFIELKAISGNSFQTKREGQFSEVTKNVGLEHTKRFLRTEAIRRGGYALAVGDINQDNISDIIVGQRDQMTVYLGQKNGTFKESLDSGLNQFSYVKSAILGDFQNNGKQDLVISFLSPNKDTKYFNDVVYLENDGHGKFKVKQDKFTTYQTNKPMPIAVADFDNDSFLDFYVGYPGLRDFSVLRSADSSNSELKIQGLYQNNRNGGFVDKTAESNLLRNEDFGHLYPHGALAVDFNQDRNIDLIVADDRNNLSPAYVGVGKGVFKQSSEAIGLGNQGFAMSINSGDFNNDGHIDLLMSNVNFNSISRMANACNNHFGAILNPYEKGLRLYLNDGNGKFLDATNSDGLEFLGQGAAGIAVIDYDNDGYQDIYLTNGLWSGSKDGANLDSLFSSMLNLSNVSFLRSLSEKDGLSFMNILAQESGVKSIYPLVVDEKDQTKPSLAGYQHNRLFRNNGKGGFDEVGYLEGVDSLADGYITGQINLGNSKFPSLILRNGDPGTDAWSFPVVQVFKNSGNKNNSLFVSLTGTQSNKDGIGSLVLAEYNDGHKQIQALTANQGTMQQERKLHFGLAKGNSLKKLTVFWPSGIVQEIKNVKAGQLKIVELKSNI